MRFLLLNIQIRMSGSGYVTVLQWNWDWFLSRRVKFDAWFGRDGGKWSFLTWTKNHSSLHRHPGNDSWGCGRDLSDSPRKSILLSPWIGRCRVEVDVLSSWSPPTNFIRPSATGKRDFPFFGGIISSFALRLFVWEGRTRQGCRGPH